MMSKKLGLAVAGAVMALASMQANAGITVPAGEWTLDFGGNVNAFYTHTSRNGQFGSSAANTIQTGLLPSAIGIGGKTRQNDLDVAFQFTFFVGADSGTGAAGGNNTLNIRQAYLTFGDQSWGSVKLGRDLGIYGSDAILSDMTLYGVGVAAGSGGNSTLGRIGSGYIYADWVGQISYQSPVWSGFQVSAGVREPFSNGTTADSPRRELGYEGKVTYDFDMSEVKGRLWVSAIGQRHKDAAGASYNSKGWDLGAKANYAGFGLVGYYYNGDGLAGPRNALSGLVFGQAVKSDDSGGYVQLTYVIPNIGTKIGLSYGESKSKYQANPEYKNKSAIIGAYHPLTKHLNLVAEYTEQKITGWQYATTATDADTSLVTTTQHYNGTGKAKTISLGAIMFF